MTNPFEGLTDSLTDEQRKLLIEALGVEGARPMTPPKKRIAKKAPIKKVATKKVAKKAPPKKKVGRPTQNDFTAPTRPDGGVSVGKRPVKFTGNEWKDTGGERNAKTKPPKKKLIPAPRTRPEAKEVDLVCSVCGRKFKVPAAIAGGEFRTHQRCDRCTG